MTGSQIIQYVYALLHTNERESPRMARPIITAVAELAYRDLAQYLVDNDSELAKKLVVTLSNQTWANSAFPAPSNMLFHKQKRTTRIDFGGTLAYQIDDRDKLNMLSDTNLNTYYALEGKTFYIRRYSAGSPITGASDLNITYYKIPAAADIDNDLRNIFLQILIGRLVPSPPQDNGSSK